VVSIVSNKTLASHVSSVIKPAQPQHQAQTNVAAQQSLSYQTSAKENTKSHFEQLNSPTKTQTAN